MSGVVAVSRRPIVWLQDDSDDDALWATEHWLPVVGYEGVYSISDLGRLRRVTRTRGSRRSLFMKGIRTKKGYLRAALRSNGQAKDVLIHNLVLKAFIGEAPSLQCNHKNGIKTDNRLVNLEWVTGQENIGHAWRLGLMRPLRGEQHGTAKLTEADVVAIRAAYAAGTTHGALGRQYGVSQGTCSRVVLRKSWAHVP